MHFIFMSTFEGMQSKVNMSMYAEFFPKLFSCTFLKFNKTTNVSCNMIILSKGFSIGSSSKNYKELGKYKLNRHH